MGTSCFVATLLSATLLLPSVLKFSNNFGKCRNELLKILILLFQTFLFISFICAAYFVNHLKGNVIAIFVCLMIISVLNACNEKFVARYYNNQLNRKKQNVLGNYKYVASQLSFIVAYGILIIFVGLHEIIFRNIHLAWSMAFYLIAGGVLILLMVNSFLLKKPEKENAVNYFMTRPLSLPRKILFRNIRFVFIIFMLLLPQSLLFATRVFFLMASDIDGGLNYTLQDVGFAQGTIGVIAFSIGTFIGQHLMRKFGYKKLFWIMVFPLIASPFFYLIMSYVLSTNMIHVCMMTFASQLCFGLGLNIFVVFINRTNDFLEDNIINLVHNPLVVVAMFVPIAFSGWLVQIFTFKTYYLINSLTAILTILTLLFNYKFIVRHILNYRKKINVD